MTHSTHANGRYPHDYHMHSHISCDSQATMTDMAAQAVRVGLREIAFTDHLDLHPLDACRNFYQPDAYFGQLEAVRRAFASRGLTIRAGVEVGEMHRFGDQIEPVLAAYPYDVVLGSLHWVGDHSMFDKEYFRATDALTVATDYFGELLALARAGGFDILAHADVFRRSAFVVYGGFDIAAYEALVRPVWQACIDNGIAIEINTSGLRRELKDTLPALTALRWYRDMGGELLTIGSDSHRPDQVAFGFGQGLDFARAAGFTRVCTFERRRVTGWVPI